VSTGPARCGEVKIPKGGGKLRTLGIPTVFDRVVQAACTAVLEPIFETDFLPCSYGFRPNRRAQDAIAEIHHLTSRPANYEYVVEADIAACFDEIDHVAVMDRVRRRVKDKRLCNLVKAFGESRGPHRSRGSGGVPDRDPTGWDSLPAAGEHRALGAG
jgi:RNA-directed DNA polymerase